MMNKNISLITVLFLCLVTCSLQAKTNSDDKAKQPSFPGGASSVSESYGQWSVGCGLQKNAESTTKVCVVSQVVTDTKTGQPQLQLQLQPQKDGVAGAFVTLFGLSFKDGVTLQIDDGPVSAPLAFLTCYPTGCVVPVQFNTKALQAFQSAKNVKFSATTPTTGPYIRSLNPDGLETALKRATLLMK